MASYVKLAAEAGDKYLSALSEFQDNLLQSAATGAEQFKSAASASKSAAKNAAATTPAFDIQIPTPQEIAEANFAFAQKLLKTQKAFVEKLLATSTSAAR